MSCIAVVVTFNRLDLLKDTLKSLSGQTRPLDQIVVVNNGSTDGTAEWLETHDDLDVVTQENVGGAGGFKTGMQRAFQAGAEWIWVMDDDVAPASNALQRLLEKKHISDCLMPQRVYLDGTPCWWGHVFDLRKRSVVFGTRPREQDPNKDCCFVNTGCFEGMLIHRRVIEKVGLPDERFFISWDDTIYGLLVSRVTNLVVVRDATIVRAKTYEEQKKVSPLFAYYHFRNFHLVGEYYSKLSGGKTYGLWGHLKYLLGAAFFLRKCWLESRSTFPAVTKAVRGGIIDSYRRKVGRSH